MPFHPSETRTCSQCGAEQPPTARFCAACGQQQRNPKETKDSPGHRPRTKLDRRAAAKEEKRLALGIGFLFVGTLGSLLLAAWISSEWEPEITYRYVGLHAGLLLAVGALSCAILGSNTWRASLGNLPSPRWLVIALPVGLGGYAISALYVRLLQGHQDRASLLLEQPVPAAVLLTVIVAPLLEEWIDRGVLWAACLRAGDERMALFLTGGLFALSHGLNGGDLFEIPHRFVGGLALGWLRWRSGSIVAPVLAHVTWNALAVWA